MKTKLTKILLGAALLFASANSGSALPPRQHAVRGIIESIDQSAHTFTVAPANGKQSLVFVWKDSTRFKQGGSRLCGGALEQGQPISLYYRREVGQLVPREVSLRNETATTCKCCEWAAGTATKK
jgi:hypothetical protein